MRTTRLAFNDLQNSFDVIAQENLRSIKGGVAEADPIWGTWNGVVYRKYPGEEWDVYSTLAEVEVMSVKPSTFNWGDLNTLFWSSVTNDFNIIGVYDYGSGGGDVNGGATTSVNNASSLTLQLINHVNSNFGDFILTNTNIILSTDIPAGYTLNPNGSYSNSSTGEISYGLTYKSGELIFVFVAPHIMTNITASSRNGLIGHELIHARNIIENTTMYNTNYSQFRIESEYAAYSYQWYFAISTGDQSTAAQCLTAMSQLMLQGATGIFTNNLNYSAE